MPNDLTIDDHVDSDIAECLAANTPRSFFLYAGAGSGKTRSLVLALENVMDTRGYDLYLHGKQVAVITFTNAAADEISRRINSDPRVTVSTIHAFAWNLVRNFQADIRTWLKSELTNSIRELETAKSRSGSKKEADRLFRLQRDRDLFSTIDDIRKFTYNPATENREKSALNHAQVIKLATYLLTSKPLLSQILVSRHPILFIDESQDTNKSLLEAFMGVATEREGEFVLGLFGDTMQRIYNDGKTDISSAVPTTWATPAKVLNHRSRERIVELVNRIRADVDNHMQQARPDRRGGTVRLFIAPNSSDINIIERLATSQMAKITGDSAWDESATDTPQAGQAPAVKRLILEHSMAAHRFGFGDLFGALKSLPGDRTSVLDGSVPELQVFSRAVEPLIEAHNRRDKFKVARIVRENSPLMSLEVLEAASVEPGALRQCLSNCQVAVDALTKLFREDALPTLRDVARVLHDTGLFTVHPSIESALLTADSEGGNGSSTQAIDAWQRCLAVPFNEAVRYSRYFAGTTSFATHQGVKGLEFPRVMAVISDEEAGGFLFSYEKLLGAKELTSTDTANETAGKDTSVNRTRRLMYVICSRATDALAIVAYTSSPDSVRNFALENEWFTAEEIVLL